MPLFTLNKFCLSVVSLFLSFALLNCVCLFVHLSLYVIHIQVKLLLLFLVVIIMYFWQANILVESRKSTVYDKRINGLIGLL